jgi:hypothetical protein
MKQLLKSGQDVHEIIIVDLEISPMKFAQLLKLFGLGLQVLGSF